MRDKTTRWDGIRNFQARNWLRAMKKGDQALFYHSQKEKTIVGTIEITREAYADPTAKEGDWSCVDIRLGKVFKKPVSLEQLKADMKLKQMALFKQARLSVTPVTAEEWKRILALSA